MPLYPFRPNDVFRNQLKTHPKVDFWIYGREIYYNNQGVDAGAFHSQSLHVEPGFISLYEMNVDRDQNAAGQMIYPYITKESGISAFKTVSTSNFNAGYLYGEKISGKYPLSASISIESWKDDPAQHDIKSDLSVARRHMLALQSTLDSYKSLSRHYDYSSSLGHKGQQQATLVSIPSIFYGSSIKKGSVSLKFYITGTLAGELQDVNKNGELIQVSGSANSLGPTARLVLGDTISADETIIIESNDGTTKTYKAGDTENLTSNPAVFERADGEDAATSLKECIEEGTHGHGGRITATIVGSDTLILEQVYPTGSGANHTTGSVVSTLTSVTVTDFAHHGTGSVAGVVLYNEGFVVLTGSWNLDPVHMDDYNGDSGMTDRAQWIWFGTSANLTPWIYTRGTNPSHYVTSSAWHISLEGVNYVPALTMFAHAPKGMLNHSNNPTYKNFGQASYTDMSTTSSVQYIEPDNVTIKNTVSSSWEVLTSSYNTEYQENSASFKRQTFISKIGIYDDKKNLIAIAKLAKPVRKTEDSDFTFKLKLDF